jgi:hypothetical protein
MQFGVNEVRTAKVVRDQLATEIGRCIEGGSIMDDEVETCEQALTAIERVLDKVDGILTESLRQAMLKVEAGEAEWQKADDKFGGRSHGKN